ncbi:MAG: enoyl-CoA hydratase/isomerase family protein [Gemmatimonadota bacterium]|nr:enoyl-CoA hydratase/isomerase family protein [Gemmatimonadota bacterium]
MSDSVVLFDVADRIATITLNRPDKLNALNDNVFELLADAVARVRNGGDIGGAIVTGAGRAFVAGADIGELQSKAPGEAVKLSRRGQQVFRQIEMLEKPVIAAVNGFAFGGGCELAMACHVRVASDQAKFGQPEVKLGTIPGYGGTQRLPRLVGTGRALQLMLTGDPIDAAEALRLGLVNAVVPASELLPAARALLGRMLANGPLALGACIDAVHRGAALPMDEALALESAQFGLMAASADMREGTTAFLEKRPPRFTGR